MATGVLVESNMARPTKVEGNPDHPASLGATDVFAQASILGLYDPDRSKAEIHDGRIGSWTEFQTELSNALSEEKASGGAGLRLLTSSVTSPSLGSQIRELLKAFPSAKWHQYESIGRDNALEGAKIAFGEYLNAVYRVDRAEVIVALDSDFLTSGPGCVRYAREFARNRRVQESRDQNGPDQNDVEQTKLETMNRLHASRGGHANSARALWPIIVCACGRLKSKRSRGRCLRGSSA